MRIRLFDLCLLALAAATFAVSPRGTVAWAGEPAPAHPVLVELFTSQGCNDCPPADKLVTELSARRDVIALSLPITYWDMLGWKDTLATDANTRRQRAYAKFMNHSGIYTPQIIIDGTTDVVGGQRDAVLAEIARHETNRPNVSVTIKASPSEVHIAIGGDSGLPGGAGATIWVMHTLSHASVDVGEGENANRELSYTNVVRDLKAIGLWKGEAMSLDLPRQHLTSVPHDGFVVVVQRDRYGQVIGAAMVRTPDYVANR